MTSSSQKRAAPSAPERLQKIIAQAGLASRRQAETWIEEGLVTVNGEIAKLGDKASLSTDAIKVKGKLLHSSPVKVYYVFYKPKNVIAMINEDDEGRPTIKDVIQNRIKERVFTVGRMDFTGEGAILLTNDGDLSQQILKSNDIIRRYHIKVDRIPSQEDLARIARGGRIEGRSMNPFHVRIVQAFNRNALIEVSFEGMGSIDVRKFIENKGFFPEKVARVGIGHINAEQLAPGNFKKVDASSFKALLEQPELAKKQIERLVQSKSKVRVVSAEDLEKDVERKRHHKKSSFSESAESAPRQSFEERLAARASRTLGDRPERTPRTERTSERAPSRSERPSDRFGERSPRSSMSARSDRPTRGFGGEKSARPSERPSRSAKPGARGAGARSAFGASSRSSAKASPRFKRDR